MNTANARNEPSNNNRLAKTRFDRQVPWQISHHSALHRAVWQFLATSSLAFGAWYLLWRWTESLNTAALWFSLPLVIAETGAFIGLILFTINIWTDRSPKPDGLPRTLRDKSDDTNAPARPPPAAVAEAPTDGQRDIPLASDASEALAAAAARVKAAPDDPDTAASLLLALSVAVRAGSLDRETGRARALALTDKAAAAGPAWDPVLVLARLTFGP